MMLIVNPAAAGGRVGREWPQLAARLESGGLQLSHRMTEYPWHASEIAEAAARDGSELVVALGGDGTVCEAAEGLWRARRGRLGILPLGTGNDFARTLGIPGEIDAALGCLLAGHRRAVDLIRVNDHVVLNAIGIGLTADINRRAVRVKVVRGITAYAATALVSLFRFAAPQVRLTTPGHCYEGRMVLLAVHNGPTTGGGFNLTPAAHPADGLLDATLVPEVGVTGRVTRLVAAMRGTLGRHAGTLELQAPWLELEHDEPLPLHLDGNQSQIDPPRTRFEILPNALEVIVPAPDAGAPCQRHPDALV